MNIEATEYLPEEPIVYAGCKRFTHKQIMQILEMTRGSMIKLYAIAGAKPTYRASVARWLILGQRG